MLDHGVGDQLRCLAVGEMTDILQHQPAITSGEESFEPLSRTSVRMRFIVLIVYPAAGNLLLPARQGRGALLTRWVDGATVEERRLRDG